MMTQLYRVNVLPYTVLRLPARSSKIIIIILISKIQSENYDKNTMLNIAE